MDSGATLLFFRLFGGRDGTALLPALTHSLTGRQNLLDYLN